MTSSRAGRRPKLLFLGGALAASLLAAPLLWAALTPSPGAAMATAAQALLDGLTPELRTKAAFGLDDALRTEWYFVPKARPGACIKNMDPRQRELAHGLLKAGLSAAGYERTTAIMALEQVLAELEKDPVKRDPELYYFSVFGKPDAKGTWGWKVEGHHVSLHFTIVKGTMIATAPQFFGSNPGEVRSGPKKGLRVLGVSEDLGRELMKALDEGQRKKAVFDAVAPKEIVTGNAAKVDPLAPVGLPVGEMKPAQKAVVDKILAWFAAPLPEKLAAERMARIKKAGVDKIRFGWAGGLEPMQPHYYRLQGPTFLIEYDNTQNDANHIHVVFRDFDGDFGRDLLREHVQKTPH